MSTIRAEVVLIQDVRPHGNADGLELATLKGWQVVVRRGTYRDGDKVVYFERGTVLPQALTDDLGVTQYMHTKTDIEGQRVLVVAQARLRGEPSFGLVIPADPVWEVGQDLADHFGAAKFNPPVKVHAGDAEAEHANFPKYTNMENMRNFPDVFLEDEEVEATEKIHGTNVRVGFALDEEGRVTHLAGSRTLRRKDPGQDHRKSNTYWLPLALEPVQSLLKQLQDEEHTQAVLLPGAVLAWGHQSGFRRR